MPKEYLPRIPVLRTEPRLSPAVSSAQLYSFDEKRPDFITYQQDAGQTFAQLAKALSQWDPALQKYAEMRMEKDADADFADYQGKMMRGELKDDAGQPLTLETAAAWEKGHSFWSGPSQAAINGYRSVLYENKALEVDAHMQQYASGSELLNIKDPAERAKMLQAELARKSQEALSALGDDPSDAPLVAKYFNTRVRQTNERLAGQLATHQAKIHAAEATQALQERNYKILKETQNQPGFFLPTNREASIQLVARLLTANRQEFMTFGLSEPEINEHIVASAQAFIEAMELGPNDDRADVFIQALNHVPTTTGFLGQTAENKLRIQQMQDRADARVDREEERVERRTRLQEAKEQREVHLGVAQFLNTNNNASWSAFKENNPELANSRFAFHTFGSYQGYIRNAQDRAETAEMLALEEELSWGFAMGTHTIQDLIDNQHNLSLQQRNRLKPEAVKIQNAEEQIKRLVGDTRYNDVLSNIKTAHAQYAEQLKVKDGAGEATKAAAGLIAHRQGIVAQSIFKAALVREVARLVDMGTPYETIQKVLPDVLERLSVPLMDPTNTIVTQRAQEYVDSNYNLSPLNPLIDMFDDELSIGPSASPARIPSRLMGYAEEAALAEGVPVQAILAVSFVESKYELNSQNKKSTAYGPMQLLTGTAAWEKVDQKDPAQNVLGGARHLKRIAVKHNLDLNNPTDLAVAYRFYHDGPGHEGPHSAEAIKGSSSIIGIHQQLAAPLTARQQVLDTQRQIQQREQEVAQQAVQQKQQEVLNTYVDSLNIQTLDDVISILQALQTSTEHPALIVLEEAVGASNIDISILVKLLEHSLQLIPYGSGGEEMGDAPKRYDALQRIANPPSTYTPRKRRHVNAGTVWEPGTLGYSPKY